MSWCMSAHDHVKNTVKNVEDKLLRESHKGLKSKRDHPYPAGYQAETDITPEPSDELAKWYQQVIGVLRWVCELLGRIGTLFKISLLVPHTALLGQGHLEAVYHVFAYLKQHLDSALVFDKQLPYLLTKTLS